MLNTPDNLTRAEMYQVAEDCGIWLDEDQTLEDHLLVWRRAVMFDRVLIIYIDIDGQMVCMVNGCTNKNNVTNPPLLPMQGGLVWRWFIKAWADMVEEVGEEIDAYLYVEDNDGGYDDRVKIFKIMGFYFTDRFKDKMRYKPY